MQINLRTKRILRTVPGKHDCSNHCLHFPVSHYTDYVCQLHWPNNFHKRKKKTKTKKTTKKATTSSNEQHWWLSFLCHSSARKWSPKCVKTESKHWWGGEWKMSIKNDWDFVMSRSCGLCWIGSNNPAAFIFVLSYVSSFSWDSKKTLRSFSLLCCLTTARTEHRTFINLFLHGMPTDPTNDVQHFTKRWNKIKIKSMFPYSTFAFADNLFPYIPPKFCHLKINK